jgi:hypothetical protein
MATYTMTTSIKARVERVHGALMCVRCQRPIEAGQAVHSVSKHNRRSQSAYKIYHDACFAAMLH